jgi:hypothetical protein
MARDNHDAVQLLKGIGELYRPMTACCCARWCWRLPTAATLAER